MEPVIRDQRPTTRTKTAHKDAYAVPTRLDTTRMLLQLAVVVASFSVCDALVASGQRRWSARSLARANRCYPTRATLEVVEETSTLAPLPPLRNRYFAVRHGQSTANLESIISSDPLVGTVTHGLTPLGREQARASAAQLTELLGNGVVPGDLVVVSSDFTRARETAEQALAALQVGSADRAAGTGTTRTCTYGTSGRIRT